MLSARPQGCDPPLWWLWRPCPPLQRAQGTEPAKQDLASAGSLDPSTLNRRWVGGVNKLLLCNSMIAKRRLGRTELMVSEMVFGGGFVGGASDHPL